MIKEKKDQLVYMDSRNGTVVPAEALMLTMLVQKHKDKIITHTVHEVLTWFDQPCLRPRMRENNSTIQ